ncbi:hypothetical protein AB9F39_37240, partial [Rhizobium leguminosarum]|uniref:hypothetical protein n=1 Tax=Rhizobium leguminosarum TaxID=384 RepID=UPI003F9AF457
MFAIRLEAFGQAWTDLQIFRESGRPIKIRKVQGRRVWDSRGRPTVEVEIELAYGATGRAIAPA